MSDLRSLRTSVKHSRIRSVTGPTPADAQGAMYKQSRFGRLSAVVAIIVAITCGGATSANAGDARNADAISITLVEPSTTGVGITAETNPDRFHRVIEPDGPRGRPLVVVLPGTGAAPAQYDDFAAHAAELGYPVVNLRYLNAFTVASVCQTSSDPDCFTKIRGEIIFGAGVPDPQGVAYSSAGASVDATNSIVGRLIALIDYLAVDDPHWDRFLIDDPTSQYVATHRGPVRLDHKKLILTGHSQGGGHAALWAMRAEVERVVMLSSPDDTGLFGSASWTLATSATPLDRFWGLRNFLEGALGQHVPFVWSTLGGAGVGAGDDTSEADVGDGSGNPNGSHRLVVTVDLGSASANHNSTAMDGRYLPGVPDAWTYLFTSCPARRGSCPAETRESALMSESP
jgi:pimeloyl-ACP methyl ester carboxylesterase